MPHLSIIIPTCDRPDTLRECLRALQSLPEGCEVVVSDDSRSGTNPNLVDFPAVRWILGPKRGPAANRNAASRAARGAWLAFLDDDCQPQPGWVQAIFQAINADDVDVLEGKTVCPDKQDRFFQEQVENEQGNLFWSCNLAIRRTAFEALGRFDEDFTEAGGEDLELSWRIRRSGLRRRFAPEALVFHPARQSDWTRTWRRTLFIRWHLLYRLKTRQSSSLETPALWACLQLIRHQTVDLLRTTAHLVTRFDSTRWRSRLLAQIWRWLTFPILLPYLAYWELRFRRQLLRNTISSDDTGHARRAALWSAAAE